MNLVDRDLTEHQITQDTDNVTTGAGKGNPTVHSHATSRLEQTRGIRLFTCTRNKLTGADKGNPTV